MKITDKKSAAATLLSVVLAVFASLYMYDFYKSLSGFIANGFREPIVMLPIFLAFFLPVFCFLVFFYDLFVRKIPRVVKMIYSSLVIAYAIADLALIFTNIGIYASNNALGVYNALPSIVLRFPYDMIVILIALAALQLFNIFTLAREGRGAAPYIEAINQRGRICVGVPEYIALSILAVVVFVFTGSGIYASFSAIENALYDLKYLYLLLWVAIIPMGNLVILTLKPSKMQISKSKKLITLGASIGVNIVFALLFLIFELTSPGFLIHIGKPLFLIAFSVSLPIEPCIIFGIMALGVIVMTVRFILTALEDK